MAVQSTDPAPLGWEGAAGRVPVRFVPLVVSGVEKEGGGLFGIGQSPSIAGSLPDARLVSGRRIGAGGEAVRVRAPGGELPAGLKAGSRLVLGLVDDRTVVCLLGPPGEVPDAGLEAWAAGQACGR